jgi:hypothetical protein
MIHPSFGGIRLYKVNEGVLFEGEKKKIILENDKE